MAKKIIFRDRQEFQAADFNNVQAFVYDALNKTTEDCISDSSHYTGFQVTQESTTEIRVEKGRLYVQGVLYVAEQYQIINLYQYLPLANKRVIAVVVYGSEVDTAVEPRDFLIDVVQGTTEPRAVAMQSVKKANVNVVAGIESADPQPPAVQEGFVPVAYVLMGTTGIESISRVTTHVMPRLREVKADVVELQAWRNLTEPRISNIITDLVSLSKKSDSKAEVKQVLELAADMARVKEKLNLPTTYHSYDADYFGNTNKIDVNNTTARIENGVLFGFAGQATANLALFNPYDPSVARFDNLVLPKFGHAVKIKTEGYAGDLSISQYQWQTHEIRKYTTYSWQWVYGRNWNWWGWWYQRYWYWYYGYNYLWRYWWNNYWGYWVKVPQTEYVLETQTQSINGAIVAQTFLVSSAFWLTRLGLYFTQVDSQVGVNVVICETENGKPVLQKALATVSINQADIVRYPQETVVNLTPVYLKPGRYAICFITQGSYKVAVVSGQNYLQGTLFFGTDGDYFTGDLTKDIMFTVYGARFEQARTEVQLQPVSLSNGITDISINASAVVPEGSQLMYEINVGGKWYPLTDLGRLASAPDIVPLRAVLLGTSDVQPALVLTSNAVVASRPTTSFTAVSTMRTLSSSRTNIEVQLVVVDFDSNNHTLNCQLIVGGNDINPSVTSSVDEDERAKRYIYSFSVSGGTTSYKIKITGSRTSGSRPFAVVERIDIAY